MSTAAALPRALWEARAAAHRRRIDDLVGPYLRSRRTGAKHPVIDFLFTYYSARPAQVTRWHPGYGVRLADAAEYGGLTGYQVDADGTASVADDRLTDRLSLLGATAELLRATASRPPRLGCFGLHEWAMVYRTDETRHEIPLRLGRAGTDAVVEAGSIRCTHFDAFRFFTDAARPLNATALTRADAIGNEQPGCLHATMDLYRYCLRLSPLIGADLLADCFALALRARTLDMRASPYDLRAHGYEPVPIETPDGRARYVHEQAGIARDGALLRERVLAECDRLIAAARTDTRR